MERAAETSVFLWMADQQSTGAGRSVCLIGDPEVRQPVLLADVRKDGEPDVLLCT